MSKRYRWRQRQFPSNVRSTRGLDTTHRYGKVECLHPHDMHSYSRTSEVGKTAVRWRAVDSHAENAGFRTLSGKSDRQLGARSWRRKLL